MLVAVDIDGFASIYYPSVDCHLRLMVNINLPTNDANHAPVRRRVMCRFDYRNVMAEKDHRCSADYM